MANMRIIVPNIVDTATLTESPAMLTTLPGTNLQKQTERERTARTTGLAAQDIKLTWTSNQEASGCAGTRNNLRTGDTVQLRHYSDAAWAVNIYNSTALAAFSTSGLDTVRDDYTARDFRGLKSWVLWHSQFTNVRSSIVTLGASANPDGYMELTRLIMGPVFELGYNPAHGAVDLTLIDDSGRERADDGTMLVNKGWRARRLVVNLDFIEDTDLPTLLAIERLAGTTLELFVSLYPGAGGAKEIYHQMACRIVDSPSFNPHQYGFHKNSIVFEET